MVRTLTARRAQDKCAKDPILPTMTLVFPASERIAFACD
jgi:hypothetical protein